MHAKLGNKGGGGFKRESFPIWTCPSFFCPFWDLSPIFLSDCQKGGSSMDSHSQDHLNRTTEETIPQKTPTKFMRKRHQHSLRKAKSWKILAKAPSHTKNTTRSKYTPHRKFTMHCELTPRSPPLRRRHVLGFAASFLSGIANFWKVDGIRVGA